MNINFNNTALILANTKRSFIYLKIFSQKNIKCKKIIILDKKNNLNKKTIFFLKKISKKILYYSKDINSSRNAIKIKKEKIKFFIYSGYPGVIINSKEILKKKIIHAHMGKLPNVRGSTTSYYSILISKNVYCSIFIINRKIDDGKILYIRKHSYTKESLKDLDKYDSEKRAETLAYFLKQKKKKIYKYPKVKIMHYYIIHPFLRYVVKNEMFL